MISLIPGTGIIGLVGLALDQVDTHSQIDKDLTETLQLAKRASNLTRQLLAYSKRQILEPEIININDLINNMSKMLKHLIGEDIKLHFAPAHDLGKVKADLGLIEQVLINLAVNARHAMHQGGILNIETANIIFDESEGQIRHTEIPPGLYVMFKVSDTGSGIDKDIQKQIFDPFFTTKEVGVGSGLGLSTAYGIVKQHKGFIRVDSEPGEGASFTIYLPGISEEILEEAKIEGPGHPKGLMTA